ncbi:uncharacterized protein Pyn_32379 [Prunus yedoensis var. nudiflora]|uniref:Uncharacterized protein n=1 Tax=Prunus yedoensis var. nudiflora TaxID=2094558 RepID=A0A314USZ7_PRUYE|nr:uncharacterized protein Pyn_32379 [Prunus yedoensis var. nudiflora]
MRKQKSGEETREEDPIGWPEWMKRHQPKVRETKKGFKGCQFWAWFDMAMCERSKAMIPGLLKSRNKLEKSMAKARQRENVVWVLLVTSWVLFASIILGGMCGCGVNKKRSLELAYAIE